MSADPADTGAAPRSNKATAVQAQHHNITCFNTTTGVNCTTLPFFSSCTTQTLLCIVSKNLCLGAFVFSFVRSLCPSFFGTTKGRDSIASRTIFKSIVAETENPRARKRPRVMTGRICLGDLTQHNIKQLKLLNTTLFPVTYTEKFYKNVLASGEFSKLAFFEDVIVGAVCCRVDKADSGERVLYIMTLGCLAPYRRLGIGSTLLKHVYSLARKDNDLSAIRLHVQTTNEDAIGFYEKHGFEISGNAPKYYTKLEIGDAHIFEKKLPLPAETSDTGENGDDTK